MKSNKDYDFKLQAEEALIVEQKFKGILVAKEGTAFEVKTERNKWHDSDNIVFEYESYGKPSGIAATKADYWVHELRSREDQTLVYLMFPTPVLRKICNALMDEKDGKRRWVSGGQNRKQEMIVADLKELLIRLQNFTGTGDEEFLTRREREKLATD